MNPRNQVLAFLVALIGVLEPQGRAELLTPPSAPISSLDAVVQADGVHVRWQAGADPSVLAYRLERIASDSKRGTAVGDLRFVPVPWPDSAVGFEAVDPEAGSGLVSRYRLVALRRDGHEAEVGRYDVEPHRPAADSTVLRDASAESIRPPMAVADAGPGQRVKIYIAQTGLYRLDTAAIASCLAGVSVDEVNAALGGGGIRMWTGTNEVNWLPAPGNTGVWFFAQTVDSIYTTNTIYWLELAAGTPMASREAKPPAGLAQRDATFPETLHFEQETSGYYNQTLFQDPEADVWFWAYMGPTTNPTPTTQVVFNVTCPGAASNTVAQLRPRMTGLTETPFTPEHHARWFVNGRLAGTVDWDGYSTTMPALTVSNLVDGTNAVEVDGYTWPGEPYLLPYYIDSFDMAYARRYEATGDFLICTADTNADLWISGFSSTNVWVFDVTDPYQVVQLTSPAVVWSNGTASVGFGADGAERRYLASTWQRLPVALRGRPWTEWRASTNRADYIAITPAVLRSGAETLTSYRAARGMVTVTVDVEDLFDEFAAGVPTPHALGDFLAWACAHWILPPRYAVLVGTGTINYKGVPGQASQPCHIPPLQVATPYGLYGSDMPLGDVNGDHVPEVAIGRLPVAATNDLADVIRKIQGYEAVATNQRPVTLNADNFSLSDGGFDFPAASDTLLPGIPAVYSIDRNYLTNVTSQMQARFRAALNNGRTLMSYVGHASDTKLANEPILSAADLPLLTNSVAPPFLVMACLFGRFDKPAITEEGLALRLVRKSGGGFSSIWGCSSSSLNDDNVAVGRWMIRACFRKNGITLGEAAREALWGYRGEPGARTYVMDTYTLIGDPAQDMGIWNGSARSFSEWQLQVFNTQQLADPKVSGEDADPDGDGADNWSEYLSGTDPLNADSRLAITQAVQNDSDGRTVRWTSVTNRLYTVEVTTNLSGPFDVLVKGVWAEPPTNTLSDAIERGMMPLFYRVRLEN